MIAEFKLTKVVTPSVTHYDTKFTFHNGTFALWASDINAWTATRIALVTDATFTKRTTARAPHIVTLQSGEQWEVWPQYSGGCNCDAHPLKHVSRDDLLNPDYSFNEPAP